MEYREIMDNLGYALKTPEGRKLIQDALGQVTMSCKLSSGAELPEHTPQGVKLRAHAIFDATDFPDGGRWIRSQLFDFDSMPDGIYAGHVHENRNAGGRKEWMVYPGGAFMVGVGLQFNTALHQSFTPTVGLALRLQTTYYAKDPYLPGQSAVLVVNRSDEIVSLHKDQPLGSVVFHSAATRPCVVYKQSER